MGHSVGDAADRATKKGQAPKAVETRPVERIIRDVRENRAAGLHVSPTDVDVLLTEYDKLIADLQQAPNAPAVTLEDREVFQKEINSELRKSISFIRNLINSPGFTEKLSKEGFHFDLKAFEAMEKEVADGN